MGELQAARMGSFLFADLFAVLAVFAISCERLKRKGKDFRHAPRRTSFYETRPLLDALFRAGYSCCRPITSLPGP